MKPEGGSQAPVLDAIAAVQRLIDLFGGRGAIIGAVAVGLLSEPLILKAIAHRPKDMIDIQQLVQANPDLDLERIRGWLLQFAELLESPELWTDVEPLLSSL